MKHHMPDLDTTQLRTIFKEVDEDKVISAVLDCMKRECVGGKKSERVCDCSTTLARNAGEEAACAPALSAAQSRTETQEPQQSAADAAAGGPSSPVGAQERRPKSKSFQRMVANNLPPPSTPRRLAGQRRGAKPRALCNPGLPCQASVAGTVGPFRRYPLMTASSFRPRGSQKVMRSDRAALSWAPAEVSGGLSIASSAPLCLFLTPSVRKRDGPA